MKQQPFNVRRLVFSALSCAAVFLATFISFPVPPVGICNAGDGFLLLGVSILGLPGVFAGAVGAALCDLIGPYSIYTAGTLIIKLAMGFVAYLILRLFRKKNETSRAGILVAGLAAELLMVGGYYLFEATFLSLGFVGALVNIPFNLVQGGVGIAVFFIASGIFRGRRI